MKGRKGYNEKGQDMKKKIASISILALLLLATATPLTAIAASYVPAIFYHQENISETVMKVGQTVYLFHSGTEDVNKTIQVNDILTVY